MRWISIEDKSVKHPLNKKLLVTNGRNMYLASYSNALEWETDNSDCVPGKVTHWMELITPEQQKENEFNARKEKIFRCGW